MPSPEKKRHPGLRLPLSSAGLSGGHQGHDTDDDALLSTRRTARPARPLTARERKGEAMMCREQDRVKRALGIPEVPATSGWTGHLPQRKAGSFNVGHTYTSAYGSITARDSVRGDFSARDAAGARRGEAAGEAGMLLSAS